MTAHSRCVLLSPVSGFLAGSVVSAVSSGTIITTGVDGEAVTVNDTTIVNLFQAAELSPTGIRTFSGKTLPVSRLLYPQVQKDYMNLLFAEREG